MTRKTDERLKDYYSRQLGYVNKRLEADRYGEKARTSKANDPEAFARRQRVWRHNSFIGHTCMMRQQLNAILAADSTTERTKQIARSMLGVVSSLQNSLQERKD